MDFFIRLFTLIFLVSRCIALQVYNSNNVDINKRIVSGLHFKNNIEGKIISGNSLTVCIRLRMSKLAQDNSARLILIQNTKSEFFHLRAKYPETWFTFGNSNFGRGFYASWILYDPLRNSYLLWRLNKWHHICFSYSKQDSRVGFVMVTLSIYVLINHIHSGGLS
jgi:hypothetical protein